MSAPLLCLLATAAAGAADPVFALSGQWVSLELPPDFDQQAGQGAGERLLARLEAAHAHVARAVGREAGGELHAMISRDQASFQAACDRPWYTAACYLPLPGRLVLAPPGALARVPDLDQVLAHEVAHAMTHAQLTGCPRWLVEGLVMHLVGQRPSAAATAAARARGRTWLADLPSLAWALAHPASRAEGEAAYAWAYFLTDALLAGRSPALALESGRRCLAVETKAR